MKNRDLVCCLECGGGSFEVVVGFGVYPVIICENCNYTKELRIAMRRAVRCPVCGYRLIDAEDNVRTQLRPINKNTKWKPDFYDKCDSLKWSVIFGGFII